MLVRSTGGIFMTIKKNQKAWDFFNLPFSSGKKTEVVLVEVKEQGETLRTEEFYQGRDDLMKELLSRLDRYLTREDRYRVCFDVIVSMHSFRFNYFGSHPEYMSPRYLYEVIHETYLVLNQWLEEEWQNGGNFFDIHPFYDPEGVYGYAYNHAKTKLYLNSAAKLFEKENVLDLASILEETLYHELTHKLQHIYNERATHKVAFDDSSKVWGERWCEKEAIFCSRLANKHRLFPLHVSEWETGYIQNYLQTTMKYHDLFPWEDEEIERLIQESEFMNEEGIYEDYDRLVISTSFDELNY